DKGRRSAPLTLHLTLYTSHLLRRSATQDPQYLLELNANLTHDLLCLGEIVACIFSLQAIARAADRETLLVEQRSNLPNDEHVLALVVAPIAAALHRLQLGKFLFPIPQDVRFHAAQLADLTDREVALARNRR